MLFKDVIGQEEAKQRLIAEVKEGRIPHAQLICGPKGTGKLPLAIAYARYICCALPRSVSWEKSKVSCIQLITSPASESIGAMTSFSDANRL